MKVEFEEMTYDQRMVFYDVFSEAGQYFPPAFTAGSQEFFGDAMNPEGSFADHQILFKDVLVFFFDLRSVFRTDDPGNLNG